MKNELLEIIYDDNKEFTNFLMDYDSGVLELPENMHEAKDILDLGLSYDTQIGPLIDFYRKKVLGKDMPGMPFGQLRDESGEALMSIFASSVFYDKAEYKAAKIFYSIIKNHPFRDGNKRIACWVLEWYLSKHGLSDCLSAEILCVLAIMVAQSPAEHCDMICTVLCHVFMNQNHHRHAMEGHDFRKVHHEAIFELSYPNTHTHTERD